jgi:DHA1 family bicyclomycin/chloramphenicol resistance-like MFS transporter
LSSVRSKPSPGLVILLGALTAFGALSIDMYLPALPAIAAEFGAGRGEVERTLASFLAGLAIGQLVYGPLSDRVGRKPPLVAGLALYIAASVGCALVATTAAMVAARFAQGLGACAALVVSRAIVRDRFDHQDSARVFSTIMLVFGLAPVLAPLVGGYVMLGIGWRGIFGLLAAFGAVVLLIVLVRLPESRSAATEATARGEHPLTALRLLGGNPRLVGYMLGGAFNSACLFTYISASPEVLMGQYGVGPTAYGWLFGLNALGMVIASQINRWLLGRYPADRILAVAAVAVLVWGAVLVVIAATGAGQLAGIMAALFGVISSYGFIFSNANAGALSVDPLRAGSVSALMGATGFAVGALAMTVTGLFADGTARPMAITMATALALACASLFGLAFRAGSGR